MGVNEFLRKLDLEGSDDIVLVERKFLDKVRQRIQAVAEHYDEDQLGQEEKWLADFHQDFFQYSVLWAREQMSRNRGAKQLPEAANLKRAAKEIMDDLQKNIVTYASCYMQINRFVTLVRDDIKKEELRGDQAIKDMKWTADIGIVVNRNKKAKNYLTEQMKRVSAARDILEEIDEDFDKLFASIATLHGKDKATAYQRSLRSALRMADFRKARKTLETIIGDRKKFTFDRKTVQKNEGITEELGNRVIAFLEQEHENLVDTDGKILLQSREADISYNTLVRELQNVRASLTKYYLPYMQHKMNVLFTLKEKLLVVGTLDSLMVLYMKLIKGLALPITNIKDSRQYENEVIEHTKYLLQGHFQEIPRVLERAHENVKEFRQNQQDLNELDQMDLQEIKVVGEEGEGEDGEQPDTAEK